MSWEEILAAVVAAINTLSPLIEQIITEIEALVNGGQPVPASLLARLRQAQLAHNAQMAVLTKVVSMKAAA